jgi:hypothetical protein
LAAAGAASCALADHLALALGESGVKVEHERLHVRAEFGDKMTITGEMAIAPEQVKAARELLGWTLVRLAARADAS